MGTRVQGGLSGGMEKRGSLETRPIMRINQLPLLRQGGEAGPSYRAETCGVIQHQKRINKCQVARCRVQGAGQLAVRNPCARQRDALTFPCYKSCFRPSIRPSAISPLGFVPSADRPFGLSSRQSSQPFVSTAFDALHIRARGCTRARELRDAFSLQVHFTFQRRGATYISATTVGAQRFSILFASNLVCETISFST